GTATPCKHHLLRYLREIWETGRSMKAWVLLFTEEAKKPLIGRHDAEAGSKGANKSTTRKQDAGQRVKAKGQKPRRLPEIRNW
ncbi:Hypothetical predicted protein, partial [Pelobates cultripes]